MNLPLNVIAQSASERIAPLKAMKSSESILVHEIFASIQGESTFAGELCTFVRTAVCHLRCRYCDTEHAFFRGEEQTIEAILNEVNNLGIQVVEVTGGEPLLQKPVFALLKALCDAGKTTLLETSGAVSIAKVDRRVHVILDVKTPGSGEVDRNVWSNLEELWPLCEVKFVICNEADYEFSKDIVQKYDLLNRCKVLFSHEAKEMSGVDLAAWLIRDRLPVRFQTQLHKVLWGDKTGV
jgi:7-carboxy-7-deazaguanine synthase